LGEEFPRDPAFEDEDNPGQRFAVWDGRATAFGTRRPLGKKRLDEFPQFVRKEGLSHWTTLLDRSPRPGVSFYWYYMQLYIR
jgi:hypothetical protein